MAHQHGHGHSHRDPHLPEVQLDAANQSLADALRASFNVLKLIMFVLVVLFLLTGVHFIEDREEAVVARFGELLGQTRRAGPSWAFPYPVDETLRVPVHQDNVMIIDDHFIERKESELGRALSTLGRPTLDPLKDGALLTSDAGLVHVQWRLVYRIDNLLDFVTRVADGGTEDAEGAEDAEELITAVLDNVAVHLAASKYTAEGITRSKASALAADVRMRVNDRLEKLGTGIKVVALEIPLSSAPIPTLKAFAQVSSAENQKQKLVREAEQERDKVLNICAGEKFPQILEKLDAWEDAQAREDSESAAKYLAELDQLIEFGAGGEARAAIFEAKSYYTEAVQGMRADEEEYNALMDEYLRAPALLYARLWNQTKRKIFQNEEVIKYHLSPGQKEVRVIVGIDPEQRMIDEMEKIRRRETHAGRK
ncbi:MAG: hypothetical protein GY842_12265 [bacterium]|nr:hypothetical protein [bacterium]